MKREYYKDVRLDGEELHQFFARYFERNGSIKKEVLPAQERKKLILLMRAPILRNMETEIKGVPIKVSLRDFEYKAYEYALTLYFEGWIGNRGYFSLGYRDSDTTLEEKLQEELKEFLKEMKIRGIEEVYQVEGEITVEDLKEIVIAYESEPWLEYYLYRDIGEFLKKEYVKEFGREDEEVFRLIDKIDWLEKELIRLYEECKADFEKCRTDSDIEDMVEDLVLTEKGIERKHYTESYSYNRYKFKETDTVLNLRRLLKDLEAERKKYKELVREYYFFYLLKMGECLHSYKKQGEDFHLLEYKKYFCKLQKLLEGHGWIHINTSEEELENFVKWYYYELLAPEEGEETKAMEEDVEEITKFAKEERKKVRIAPTQEPDLLQAIEKRIELERLFVVEELIDDIMQSSYSVEEAERFKENVSSSPCWTENLFIEHLESVPTLRKELASLMEEALSEAKKRLKCEETSEDFDFSHCYETTI